MLYKLASTSYFTATLLYLQSLLPMWRSSLQCKQAAHVGKEFHQLCKVLSGVVQTDMNNDLYGLRSVVKQAALSLNGQELTPLLYAI